MDVGVLGGTFDPIHLGHLIMAEEGRRRLGLAQVLFVPAGQPWLKADKAITPSTHRIEMVKRAIGGNSSFRLSTVEVDRPGPSYTVDTMASLQQELGVGVRLFLLLGSDSLAELPSWKEASRLMQMCRLVVAPRPGFGQPDVGGLNSSLPGIARRLVFLDMRPVDISSSDVRRRIAEGLTVRCLVPDEVEGYIREQKLYQKGA